MCIKPLHVGRVSHSHLYNSNEPPAVQLSVHSQSVKSRIWKQMKGCSIVLQESRWKQFMISLIWRFNWESWPAWGHETKAWLTINQRVKGRLSEMRGCNQEIVLIGKVNRAGWRTLIFCLFSDLLNSEPQVCCLHLLSVTPLLQEDTLLQKKSVKGLDLMFPCIKNQLFLKDKPDLYKNGMKFIMWHICQSNYRWNLGKSSRILSAEDQRKHLLLYEVWTSILPFNTIYTGFAHVDDYNILWGSDLPFSSSSPTH